MAVLEIFGRQIRNAEFLAEEKFRTCPWPFFDGVPDHFPNRLVWGDFAITRVMGSGVHDGIIPALDSADIENANGILATIPVSSSLAEFDEDPAVYERVSLLFKAMRAHRLGMSRIAKVLCRKRPQFIPMLDKVVTSLLWQVARRWATSRSPENQGASPPEWFDSEWNVWTDPDHPRVYLRMVREAMRPALGSVRAIRAHLARVPATGVPVDAPPSPHLGGNALLESVHAGLTHFEPEPGTSRQAMAIP
jgi:hypothetical protein